jgi:hypothetical protein
MPTPLKLSDTQIRALAAMAQPNVSHITLLGDRCTIHRRDAHDDRIGRTGVSLYRAGLLERHRARGSGFFYTLNEAGRRLLDSLVEAGHPALAEEVNNTLMVAPGVALVAYYDGESRAWWAYYVTTTDHGVTLGNQLGDAWCEPTRDDVLLSRPKTPTAGPLL